jgi:CubicO group peptidase (beta-lactamase class C family)
VKVSYTDIPALLPPEAVEGIGALLTIPGGELPGGGCVTTVQDVHRFAEMLRRGGELDGFRLLSPAMLDFCTQNHTGDKRNILFDMWTGTRDWIDYPANIGVGFFMRGEGNIPGLFSVMNSPRTFGGFGAGSTGFTVDPERDLTFSFLSTGLMEDSYHFERVGVMAGLVLAAMTE